MTRTLEYTYDILYDIRRIKRQIYIIYKYAWVDKENPVEKNSRCCHKQSTQSNFIIIRLQKHISIILSVDFTCCKLHCFKAKILNEKHSLSTQQKQ